MPYMKMRRFTVVYLNTTHRNVLRFCKEYFVNNTEWLKQRNVKGKLWAQNLFSVCKRYFNRYRRSIILDISRHMKPFSEAFSVSFDEVERLDMSRFQIINIQLFSSLWLMFGKSNTSIRNIS